MVEGAGSAAADQGLRCLLLPLKDVTLLLPGTAVAEVSLGAQVRPASDGGPDWFCGWAEWRGLRVPVLALETVLGGSVLPPARGQRRIAVLNTLNGNPALPFVAVAIDGTPRQLQAATGGLGACRGGEEAGALCRLQLAAGEAVIPDLDALEQWLLDIDAVAREAADEPE